jgi:hypothetical protein
MALTVLALAACGGNDSNCDFAKLTGTYQAHFDEKSGDCGPLPDINVLIDQGNPSEPVGCTVNDALKDEAACTADYDITCTSGGVAAHEVAHFDIASDGSHFSGSETVTATGTTSCTSTYDVTYTKQ